MGNLDRRHPVRGFLISQGVDPQILVEFQYNPEKITDKRSANYATLNAPGMILPVRQYTSGGDRTVSFTVLVDGLYDGPADESIAIEKNERGGITPELDKYRAFTYPATDRWQDADATFGGFTGLYGEEGQVFTAPPVCSFGWGDTVVDCVVTEVQITEQLFNGDLDPIRAEVQVTCVELTPYNPDPAGR